MTTPIALSDWPRLLTLVGQALDLPAGEREAWSQGLGLPAHMKAALRDLLDEQQALQTGNFLDALPLLPDCAGVALGIDRMLQAMLASDDLADVLTYAFAQA